MGITTRAITRTRTVNWTAPDGTPEIGTEQYTVHVPRDWRRLGLAAATVGTATILAAAVAWSTASIGALLALAGITAAVAYVVAAVFDIAWIICMILEWLARYEPAKARPPRIAGYVALLLAMGALFTHGLLAGGPAGLAVGIIGSFVSAIAKGTWTLLIRHTSKPLSPLAQQWVQRQRDTVDAELVMATLNRDLTRSRAQVAAFAAAYAPDTQPDPDKPSGQPDTVSPTVRSAVRAALATMPDATPDEIVEQLARIGIDTHADTVRTLSDPWPDTPDSSSGTVLELAPHPLGESIADTVRRAVRDGVRDTDDVLTAVRRVHGPAVSRDTVTKTLRRVS